ncbi:unnamed protein product [Caenorhabditis sp. 36 PRJEB53466]|nr:unnamed protein product [Caenorhabditis sp. 36 PRJEB53466]
MLLTDSIFILLIFSQKTSSQPFIPFGTTSLLFGKLDTTSVSKHISPQCASETGMFSSSLRSSSQIMEVCRENCLEKLKEHMWALKQLDAFGKIPAGISQWLTTSEGSYATCNEVDGQKYETNYCYLMMVPGKNSTCPPDEISDPLQIKLKLATCIPLSCTSQDVSFIFNALSPFPLTACRTYCVKKTPSEQKLGFWSVILAFFVTSFITLYLLANYIVDRHLFTAHLRFIRCFSIHINLTFIFERTKQIRGVHLKGLSFIKFWSAVWVIVVHSYPHYALGESVKKLLDARLYYWNHLVFDAAYAIETFVLMSSTLLSFNLFKNPNPSILIHNTYFWPKAILRRYFRLMIPVIPWLLVITITTPFIRGPNLASMFNNFEVQAQKCSSNWWMNILMIHNFFKPTEICYPPSWYISSDFQLFLLAPLVLIPLIKSQRKALKIILLLLIISVIFTFITFWYHDLPPVSYSNVNVEPYLNYYHQQAFARIPTFLIGILRNSGKCWIAYGFLFFLCFYGKLMVTVEFGGEEVTPILGAAHDMLHKLMWNLSVAWIIYACQHDLGFYVTTFINNSFWQPFGKISYCIYIVHWWVMYTVLNLSDKPLRFVSVMQMFCEISIPTLALSLPLALVWSVLFEVPLRRIRDLFDERNGCGKQVKH